jgi:ATP-dependent DNA helicase DinG
VDLDWRPFFPEANPREIQIQILDFVTNHLDEADAFFIEAPAGVGKSAIAVTLARWFHSRTLHENKYSRANEARTYISTTTVALEDQYMRSYATRGLVQLHSAAHYRCSRPRRANPPDPRPLSCEEGKILAKILERKCPGERPCPYTTAKEIFAGTPFGIANAAYLLTESTHVGKLGSRGLFITDEGHTLAEAICNFLELRLTAKKVASFGVAYPLIAEDANEIPALLQWLREAYLPALAKKTAAIQNLLRTCLSEEQLVIQHSRDLQAVEGEMGKVQSLLENVDATSWVLERGVGARGGEFLALTPLSASNFSRRILNRISPKLILLSATIIDFDYHAFELGIDPSRLGTFQAPSPFAAANRPIFVAPCIKLDHRNLDATCEEAAHYIAPILDSYPGQRGIIFTSSYPQARGIVEAVNRLTRENRLATHTNSEGKNILLKMHEARADSVLVSPSMHEGIDLKDDLSRFQIVTKLPFPSLGSKIVQGRMRASPAWYAYSTVLKLIQATGRSIRTETDTAATYILDESFNWFYNRNRSLFPPYWQEAVQFI